MNVYPTSLPEVFVIEPDVHRDARGFFLESYHARKYAEQGIPVTFVQDNHSQSVRGTLRGLHAQLAKPQGKLVRVIRGEIVDVAVDIRHGSPSFGSWVSVTLSSENFLQVYIPPGFAHGFCVVSELAEVEYKCTDFYEPADQISIRWDDPALGIRWPLSKPILSDKDRDAPLLSAWLDRLPRFQGPLP